MLVDEVGYFLSKSNPIKTQNYTSPTPYWRSEVRRFVETDDERYFGKLQDSVGGHSQRVFNLWGMSGEDSSMHNACLEKLVSRVNGNNGLVEAWLERQDSIDLVAKRGAQLAKIVRAIVRRDEKSLATMFGKVRGAKIDSVPSLWLEYNFGVKPLIGSIDEALNVFRKEFPWRPVRARTKRKVESRYNFRNETDAFEEKGEIRLQYGLRVKGIDPHYALMGSTGLLNPISSAWAVFPWSWAIDYIGNVSQLLMNMEPRFPGVTVADEYTTRSGWCKFHSYRKLNLMRYDNKLHTYVSAGYTTRSYSVMVKQMSRSIGFRKTFKPEIVLPDLKIKQASYVMSALSLTMKGKQ